MKVIVSLTCGLALALVAACAAGTAPGGDVALEATKLDDITTDPAARFRPVPRDPDEEVPVIGSQSTAAAWSGVWAVQTPNDAVIAGWMLDLRNRGVTWHRASCIDGRFTAASGTKELPASVETSAGHWPADVLLALVEDPSLAVGEVKAPFVQLRITVERGTPGDVPEPSPEPSSCGAPIAALVSRGASSS